jgi:hypothetical protein
MRQAAVVVFALLGIVASTTAEGLTLKDFQPEPKIPDPFFDAVLAAGVEPAEMVMLAVSNDSCELGLTDDEILRLLDFTTRWGLMTRPEGEPVKAAYDLEIQSFVWERDWNASARVVRLQMCEPWLRAMVDIRG